MDKNLDKLLHIDAFAEAEQATGVSYKESKFTESLAFLGHIELNARKQQALLKAGDTPFGATLTQYLAVVSRLGFRQVLEISFASDSSKKDESFFVFWQPERGILLKFDTYCGRDSVNGGDFYYNVRPHDRKEFYGTRCISSGHFTEDGLWVGSHDCREALAHHIGKLEEYADWVVPWVENPITSLTHHGDQAPFQTPGNAFDHRGYFAKSAEVARERAALLPADVLQAIGPFRYN